MGKLRLFQVNLENTSGVYRGGQVISGNLQVVLDDTMKFSQIRMTLVGAADVHWTERHSRGKGKGTRTVHYRNHQDYFHVKIICCGDGAPDGRKELPAGNYVFPFSMQLPANLPSSFEGQHGNVRYYVKATIDKPWKFDHNTKRMFTVLDTYDLNYEPSARNSGASQNSKTLGCLCCEDGPLEADATISKTGYAAGEHIVVNSHIENHCKKPMERIEVKVVQNIAFISTRKTRNRARCVVSTVDTTEVTAGYNGTRQYKLQIPAIPPSHLRFCNIIDISYCLVLTVVTPGVSFNLDVTLPILVGSIPVFTTQALPPSFNTLPPTMPSAPTYSDSTAPPAAALPPPDYSSLMPPPSYASCTHGTVDVRDEQDNDYLMGDTQYAPQYQYYDWSQNDKIYR